MIVVRSRQKDAYLEALHQADLMAGKSPSEGAHAELQDIAPFARYMTGIMAEEINDDVLFVSELHQNYQDDAINPRCDVCTASGRHRDQYVSRSKDSEVLAVERLCRAPFQ